MPRWRDPVIAQGSRSTTQARADDLGIPLMDRDVPARNRHARKLSADEDTLES
jgi:hypothetical protein